MKLTSKWEVVLEGSTNHGLEEGLVLYQWQGYLMNKIHLFQLIVELGWLNGWWNDRSTDELKVLEEVLWQNIGQKNNHDDQVGVPVDEEMGRMMCEMKILSDDL